MSRRTRRRRGPGLLRVAGASMEPTLRAGDVLLVWWGARSQPGDLVVFRHPSAGVLTVKRLTGHDPSDPSRWWVERDSATVGSDSWSFGSLARDDLLARVITRVPTRRHRE